MPSFRKGTRFLTALHNSDIQPGHHCRSVGYIMQNATPTFTSGVQNNCFLPISNRWSNVKYRTET